MKCLICLGLQFGSARPYSTTYCNSFYKTLSNIINISKNYDFSIVINSEYTKDSNVFNYLPLCNLKNSQDSAWMLDDYLKLQSKHIINLTKNTFSGLRSTHNSAVILKYNFQEITVCGMVGSLDVLPTVMDLIDNHPNVNIYPDGIDDLDADLKNRAIDLMKFIGVKTI